MKHLLLTLGASFAICASANATTAIGVGYEGAQSNCNIEMGGNGAVSNCSYNANGTVECSCCQ